ncbi:SusC/RagA family TonB-linked outer membrane protein [Flavobacteriaceae bacterium F08102]|nr:SusC/RagA family TonB-linked outer membrane protein [Flavobacteriaceae bacterium F08102]
MEFKLNYAFNRRVKKLLLLFMKTFILLFCTSVFSLTTIDVFSQNAKINIDKDKTVSVDEVFDLIRKQTKYTFLYHQDLFKKYPKVTLKKGTIRANKLLEMSLSTHNLIFELSTNNTILIKENSTNRDQQIVTGKVTNERGDPLYGVNVIEKNTNNGVATEMDGTYRITVANKAELVFSFVGYITQQKIVGSNAVIDIVLKESSNTLDEIVLASTGYQEIPLERVTGSYNTISSDEIRKAGSNLSLKNRLEDLIPGMYFESNFVDDQNATEEDSRSIVIRGISTFGNNNPLIVVDGFPIDPDVVDPWTIINPDDVASVTVLKDAAAASIWGAQAANGVIVIVIVTKKGNVKSNTTYNVSVDYLVKQKPKLSRIPWANSKDAIDVYRSFILDGEYFDSLLTTDYDKYDLPEVIRVLVDMKSGRIGQAQGDARLAELAKLDVRNEFSELFLQPESFKKANLSIQAGGKNHVARSSITAISNEGYAKGNSTVEFLANITDQYTPKDWLKLSLGLNLYMTNEKKNGVSINDLSYIPQHSRILDDNGNFLPMIKEQSPYSFYDFGTEERRDSVASYSLPYNWDWNLKQDVDTRDNTFQQTNLRINTHLVLTPVKPLKFEVYYQYTRDNSVDRNYYNEESWTTRSTVNFHVREDGTLAIPPGGMLSEIKGESFSHSIRSQFLFNKKFNKHEISLLGGTEWRKDVYERIPYGYYGYDPQSLTSYTGIDFGEPITPRIDGSTPYFNTVPVIPGTNYFSGISGKDSRYVSYYGNTTYNFDNRYDISGSIRIDKTNLYGQSKNYRDLPQWSVGFGWKIDNEKFFSSEIINNLRFRASYGFNGNIDKSASPYILGYAWSDPITFLPYSAVQTAPNPNLTWEKTEVTNFGLDFSMLNNRLKGTLEYYTKFSSDVLTNTEINGTYGYQNNRATLNAGNIKNSGVEITLSPTLINNQDFQWKSQFILGTNKNKTSGYRPVGFSISSYLTLPYYYHLNGLPVDYIYAMKWAGYDDEGFPQYFYGKENNVVSAAEGKNITVSELDSVAHYAGRRNPNLFGSFSNSINYKNFQLNFRLSYKFGHKFFGDYPASNMSRYYLNSNKYFTWLPELIVNRWQSPADAETASMHSLNQVINNSFINNNINYLEKYGDHKLMDAGQIRLQSINLAYRFPKTMFKWMKNATLQLEARNLGPIWVANKQGIDPSNPAYSSSTYGALRYVTRYRPEYSLNLRFEF